jgi:hypothetical protein
MAVTVVVFAMVVVLLIAYVAMKVSTVHYNSHP